MQATLPGTDTRRRRTRLGLAVLVALVNVSFSLALASAPALASEPTPHPFLFSFGSFTNPNGIAVDESTGDVYVADIATDTVNKFDAAGNPVEFTALHSNSLTGAEAAQGSFSFPDVYGDPAALAVDNSTDPTDPSRGDLYVMDAGHGVIDKYGPEGKYLNQITGFTPATGSTANELRGIAVDTHGNVHANLYTSTNIEVAVDEFDNASSNRLVAKQLNSEAGSAGWKSGIPEGVSSFQAYGYAISSAGDDYLLYEACACTVKLGQQLAPLGRVNNNGAGDVALATDPATGHLYTDDQSSVVEWDTGAMNQSPFIEGTDDFESVGTLGASFGSEDLAGGAGQGGIAVDGASGDIYVSNPADGKVYVFGSDAPAVAVSEATGVTKGTATLNGSVDPRGVALAFCEFEYGSADEWGRSAYGHSAPCTPAEIGAGNSPVSVSAEITGLTAGQLYRFRLKAANSRGSSESADLLATLGEGFGVKSFEVSFLNEDGTPDTQAGSHPYQLVNNIEFNSHFIRKESNADSPYVREPDGTIKNVTVDLPPGLVGNPNATPKKCTLTELQVFTTGHINCPSEAALGYLSFSDSEHINIGTYATEHVETVYSMVPPRGVALQLGANFVATELFINNGLLAGGDYPIQATVVDAPPAAPVYKSKLTIYGVFKRCTPSADGNYENSTCTFPSAPGHGAYERLSTGEKAFLTLPTGCHGPLRSTIAVESYQGARATGETITRNSAGQPVSLTGCSKLQFPPAISVVPDTTDGSTSSGLSVGVKVPQTAAFNPNGLAESSLRDTTVALPAGVALNPAGADGLEACTGDPGALPLGALGSPGDEIGFKGLEELNPYEPGVNTATFSPEVPNPEPGANFCPNGSKIGTVKIKTPLLEHELEGAVYLASQDANPFGSLVAMYMVAEDPFSGSLIKLAGEVQLCREPGEVVEGITCAGAGQIVTTFKNTPDLPFEELQLHFFGGERAPLATPSQCGTYTTKAIFTPWDGNGPVPAESSFQIEHGPHGGPCPGSGLPFSPSLAAGSTSNQAGGLTPFTMTMSREDGQQTLQSVALKMPPGLSGLLTGVELCPEALANAGTCGPGSLIGETTVSVGVGNDPFTVTGGKVYLTGPYEGAPFGLSIVNPAKAGPYDLEDTTLKHPACDCLVVRAKIEVNPSTAALTVTSDNEGPYKIPTMIEGIPLEIKHVNVTINRAGFTFNPTNCNPLSIEGALHSTEGATSQVTVPFQATNCAALKFEPGFAATTSGQASHEDGTSLAVKLSYPPAPFGSEANIRQVKVELPTALPSRLSTLQKACTAAQFASNPAGCPAASVVGHAKALTPLLPVALEGPAYFVSNGNESFPNLIMVLQGYGVTIDLVGDTFIKNGITSSTFKAVPDQPVSSFELDLPSGPHSALAANENLCHPTKTVTIRRKVTRRIHGRTVRRTVTKRQVKATTLSMPTEFVAQNGATIHRTTTIQVTGCAKKGPARRTKKNPARKGKAKHGHNEGQRKGR